MCEVESSVVTGDDMTPPLGLLNDSGPEGVPEIEREEEVLLAKSSGGAEEGEALLAKSFKRGEIEIPQEDIKPPEEVPTGEVTEERRASVGTQDPFGGESRISQVYILSDLAENEGVDPFKPIENGQVTNGNLPKDLDPEGTILLREPSFKDERRDSKTVSFREPEKEDTGENEAEVKEHPVLRSTSSNGSQEGDGAVEKMKSSSNKQQRSLGENNNPVYRLSMKLSPNLFNIQEIPGATQHREAEKAGYLTKLSGRSFPYIVQWKRRYCVLCKGRLYYYEREDSKSGEKSNGVINLEYFDQVTEAAPKDCKKATNVFVITSQDRSFFDPGRHLFSADTLPDMKDWVRKLQSALEQTRNNNRPTTTTTATSAASPSIKKDGGKKPKEQATTPETNSQNNTKERKKKKESLHRPRKSSKVADVPDGNQNPESAELPAMTSPIGIQLPGMTSGPRGGVALPGLSPTRKEAPPEEAARETTISDSNQHTDDGLPVAGPTLACVTKLRNKGPQGRRAPQNRRTNADSVLKKRASSLSALEHQELNDNRSESSQGTRDSDRLSKTTENDLEAVEEEENSSEQQTFEDIDKDLFFNKSITDIVASESETTGHDKRGGEGDGKATMETKSSSPAKELARNKENHVSRSRSRNSSLFGNRFSRFRETMMTFKSSRYQSKEAASAGHPDEAVERSRWGCSIL